MPLINPSLLSCNFLQLQQECDMLNRSEADWFHLDIMDGTFVPNISFGLPIVQQIRTATSKPCDVHLMIQNPEKYIQDFKSAGADHLIVHYEACTHLHRNLEQIKHLGMKAGIAINPHTPVSLLEDILYLADIICFMSVNPGFGGQQFIPHSLQKIRQLRQMIDDQKLNTIIEIDGGVTLGNAANIVKAGAHALIAGSTIFNAPNPVEIIAQLKRV